MSNLERMQKWPRTYPRAFGAAALSSALVLGACSSEQEQAPTPEPATVTVTSEASTPIDTSTSAETTPAAVPDTTADELECGMRRVYPGERYSVENTERISRQLELLTAMYTDEPVRIRDTGRVGQMMRDSWRDPLYAQALFRATEDFTAGKQVDVDTFLAYDLDEPEMCSTYYATRDDQQAATENFIKANNEIMRRLGDNLTDQGSAAARGAYETAKRTYLRYCEQHNIPDCEAADTQ